MLFDKLRTDTLVVGGFKERTPSQYVGHLHSLYFNVTKCNIFLLCLN
jgi:hypothetical protein